MNPDRWQRLNELFHAALQQPSDLRERFIQQACEDDETMRAELSSLLRCHDQATSFLETPAASAEDALSPESLVSGAANTATSNVGSRTAFTSF